jgi:hypothetical protein
VSPGRPSSVRDEHAVAVTSRRGPIGRARGGAWRNRRAAPTPSRGRLPAPTARWTSARRGAPERDHAGEDAEGERPAVSCPLRTGDAVAGHEPMRANRASVRRKATESTGRAGCAGESRDCSRGFDSPRPRRGRLRRRERASRRRGVACRRVIARRKTRCMRVARCRGSRASGPGACHRASARRETRKLTSAPAGSHGSPAASPNVAVHEPTTGRRATRASARRNAMAQLLVLHRIC